MDQSVAEAMAGAVAAVARIDAIPSILEIACRATGLRFAAVSHVTSTSWTACAVRDGIGFGLQPGGQLELQTTICDEVRDAGRTVAIDHVENDARFRDHHTPKLYGFQSYISAPIVRRGGEFFGTLCALDPLPARVSDDRTVAMFESFAQLIALQLDEQDKLAASEAALSRAGDVAELREQFIAILGHDLRNPVAAISAGTTLLANAPLDGRCSQIVAQMGQSVKRMTALIDDLLDFARGRLGSGLVLTRTPALGLEGALRQVIAELEIVHPGRRIDCTIALRELVTCDVERITQLASNLLANALTHGVSDQPVRIEASSAEGEFRLSVANGGTPIPRAAIAHIFQPFTRAAEAKSPEGLGLGLYIASEIARAHGGTLDVVSDQTETRFTLTLPCNASQ